MRHKNKTLRLGRKAGPRKALMRGLVTNFALRGKMRTTLAKAKGAKPIIEKFITISKVDNLTNRRKLLSYFYNEKVVNKMFKEIGPKYIDRKGGYTRIVRLIERKGDNAKMALIELV